MKGFLLDIAWRLTGVVDTAVAHLSMLDTLLTGLTVRVAVHDLPNGADQSTETPSVGLAR